MQSTKKVRSEKFACFITGLIVLMFFIHTLNYSWKYFDEQMIYNETLLPVPKSIFEAFNYISNFGLFNYFEASNPFYSNITNLRCNPLNTLISLFAYTVFQKNSFNYHLASLLLHIFNTCILFLTLNKIYDSYNNKEKDKYKPFIISSLTLIWALHPTIVEPIAFITNWIGVLSYSFFLFTFYLFLIESNPIVIFFMFLFSIFICEYSVTLPLILFIYCFTIHKSTTFSEKIFFALQKTGPTFIGLAIYIISFLSQQTKTNFTTYPFEIILERIFWLSPQIFFHFIKLIFIPIHLTIDQTGNVLFEETLFTPYSIFCFLFMYSMISFALVLLFIKTNFANKEKFIILISSFLISLLPFLQIISPTYCLVSERYLYLPIFFLVFGISHFLFNIKNKKIILIAISFLLLIYSGRCYIRTFDWKDSITLFSSASKENFNPILKAIRLQFIGTLLASPENPAEIRSHGIDHINKSINLLKDYAYNSSGFKNTQAPKILTIYGLDRKTLKAKAAYLLAFEKYGLEMDLKGAYETLKPFMDEGYLNDPAIISFYSNLLSLLDKDGEAKEILEKSSKKTMSPLTLIPLTNIYIDEKKFSKAVKKSKLLYKYFPYNVQVLETNNKLYLATRNNEKVKYFSKLLGLRMHINSK